VVDYSDRFNVSRLLLPRPILVATPGSVRLPSVTNTFRMITSLCVAGEFAGWHITAVTEATYYVFEILYNFEILCQAVGVTHECLSFRSII
jgi:hypothetical protein